MRTPTTLVLAACLMAGCSGGKSGEAAATPSPAGIAVEVAPAALGPIATETVMSGDIRAAQEAQVLSKVGGRLATLAVDEGTKVAAGQVIATIDPQDYQLQVLQSRTSLASAVAARASAVSRLATAQDNLRRFDELFKEGAVSAQQMVTTRGEADAARIAVLSADAQIAQARAAIAIAEKQVADALIKAPFAGVVTKKSIEAGVMVGAMTPIATVAAVKTLEVQVPVGQVQLAGVKVGQQATFTVPTYKDREFVARVAEIAPTVDPKTRSAVVTIRIPNDQGLLSPGMFARVKLPTSQVASAVLVPPTAIVTEGEDQYVFVVKGDAAERRKVTVGLRTPERVEIASGLRAGDPVVVLGQGQLQPGDKVRVVDPVTK